MSDPTPQNPISDERLKKLAEVDSVIPVRVELSALARECIRLRQGQAWVSVEERLPGEKGQWSEPVLIAQVNGWVGIGSCYDYETDHGPSWTGNGQPVSHWMPLPPPPTKGGE